MSRAELAGFSQVDASRVKPREFVETYQRDLLRLAFTLTGSAARARALSSGALFDVLTTTRDVEFDPNSWTLLVTALGRRYMARTDAGERAPKPEDDEAERLREALELLNRQMRAALVLRDLGGLAPKDVIAVTSIEPDELDEMLAWSRERLVDAAQRLAGEPPQRLLAWLATGAPRGDLWPELAPAVEEHAAAERRRTRRTVIAVLAGFLVLALISAIWLLGGIPFGSGNEEPASFVRPEGLASATATTPAIPASPAVVNAAEPTPTPARTPASVRVIGTELDSDLLIQASLLDETLRGADGYRWFSYTPQTESVVALDSAANQIQHISPDGRWVLLLEWRRDEGISNTDMNAPPQVPVLTVAHDGVLQDWEYVIPYTGFPTSWDAAIAGDRLYIIASAPEPATITALDLATGETVARKTIEVPRLGAELRAGWIPLPEGSWYVEVGFFVLPDAAATELYAYVTLAQQGPEIRDRWTRWLYRIDRDDLSPTFLNTGAVVASTESEFDWAQPDFPIGRARVLPDNSGLYITHDDGRQMRVDFFDIESGEIQELTTAFSTGPNTDPATSRVSALTSNDGQRLYLYSSSSGEVAIVDLARRAIERTFALDLNGFRDSPIPVEDAQLSPDGRFLFLTEYIPDDWLRTPSSPPPATRPLWVVDLAGWRVVQRIEVPGDIRDVTVAPDSASVHTLSQVSNREDPQRWRFVISTFDTATFEQTGMVELAELTEQNANLTLISPAGEYRAIYGRAPTVDGVAPDDIDDFTTLPQARVRVLDEQLPVGITVPVELEFLDPATGEPLGSDAPFVRYDAEQQVTLAFERPGAKSVVSVGAELAPGEQRGTVKLKEAGWWNARIVVGEGGEGGGFTLILRDVFRGTPTFEGTDGRPYVLRLESDPQEPVAEAEIMVRALFVDAATGDPLPEGVTLVDGLPDELRLALVGSGSLIRDLPAVGHGVYANTFSISAPGTWTTRLIFRQPESEDTLSTQLDMQPLTVTAP